jgi:fructoselysine-6-P-deglycase FrlB-like protein
MDDQTQRTTPAPRPDTGPFDPRAPLPGAPDPWAASEMPALRAGPPYAMTEMIAAEPALARRIVGRLAGSDGAAARLAGAVHATAGSGRPIVVTGCGTSEHGALAVAEILRDGLGAIRQTVSAGSVMAAQALELALEPPAGGLCIGVSHEGGTWATNLALAAARGAGCTTALITVSGRSPGAELADIVIETGEMDQSWCHTIGYVSPILAATAVASHLAATPAAPEALAGLLQAGLDQADGAASIGAAVAAADHVVVIGSGADRTAARELVLKIEEGCWVPAAMRDLETMLHGHLPSTGRSTALVLLLTDRRARPARVARARQLLEAAAEIGLPAGAVIAAEASPGLPDELTPAGRVTVPDAPELPASVASLVGTATPLQLVAERAARTRGTNPDPIRRDDPVYREAAARAE